MFTKTIQPNKNIIIILILTFILIDKGWMQYSDVANQTIKYIQEQSPDIKGIYFYDRPDLNVKALYSVAGTITFYDKWYDLSSQLSFAKHEICHHKSYRLKGNLRHKDQTFINCVRE